MEKVHQLFLEAVAAGLKNTYVSWTSEISPRDWEPLFALAENHRVLPLVFQAVHRCPALAQAPAELLRLRRAQVLQLTALQVRQTAEFTEVRDALTASSVRFLVVKGIICRNLYPNPDFRLSGDEDLLVHPDDLPRCHSVLTELGYTTAEAAAKAHELSYHNPRRVLHLEIHRNLFPPEQPAYGELNGLFPEFFSGHILQDGTPTLGASEHMLYLLCHAFKHFLHSGFGIRQVCDIMLFANRWGEQIDWALLLERCKAVRADRFAAGLFRIGWKYLGFSPEQARYPLRWQAVYTDEGPLLQDILEAGVYGKSRQDRLHSSNVTLQALEAQKKGRSGTPLLRSLFPKREAMEAKYPYVRKSALLLPLAWFSRLLKYKKSSASTGDTVRIGDARLALLEKYGILDEKM